RSYDAHSQSDIEQQLARLREAAGVHTDTALAKALGITQGGISSAKRRGRIPDKWLVKTASVYGVYLEWLHSGKGPMRMTHGREAPHQPGTGPFAMGAQSLEGAAAGIDQLFVTRQRYVPVLGFAASAVSGWYVPNTLAMHVPLALESPEKDVFAVVMTGHCMEPDGIRQGHVLFCAAGMVPEPGDAVFIERCNGTVGVRRFEGQDKQWLYVQAWKDPDTEGRQVSFTEKLAPDSIKTLACVMVIRRRA
ncbi:helix-turn-helix domain-containing protein, partial [Desulfovibrio sp. OttesenSCG-928-I05]|nr:helix-turn-helix domain-containing protein [Desulfovibrio sp. OttesenSCG-928-I05]